MVSILNGHMTIAPCLFQKLMESGGAKKQCVARSQVFCHASQGMVKNLALGKKRLKTITEGNGDTDSDPK